MTPATTVVVLSCAAYHDLWPLLARSLEKYWPDRPWPVALVTDEVPAVAQVPRGWRPIQTGQRNWSDNLGAGLALLADDFDYGLVWLEDLLPSAPVPTPRLLELEQAARSLGWDYIRVSGDLPPPVADGVVAGLGRLPEGDIYRGSIMVTLWRLQTLREMLLAGESAWQFETRGAARTDRYANFFAERRSSIACLNTIIKGKWDPRVFARLRDEGIVADRLIRESLTAGQLRLRRLAELRTRLFRLVPRPWRRRTHLLLRNY